MAEVTLKNVTVELQKQNSLQQETYSSQVATKQSVDGLRKDFAKMFGLMQKQMRMAAEDKREAGKEKTAGKKQETSGSQDAGKFIRALLGVAIIAVTAAITAVTSYFKGLTNLMKLQFKGLSAIGKGLGNLMKGLYKGIDNLLGGELTRAMDDVGKIIQDGKKVIGNAVDKNFIRPLRTAFDDISKRVRDFQKVIGKNIDDVSKNIRNFVNRIVEPVRNFYRRILDVFSKKGRLGKIIDDFISKFGKALDFTKDFAKSVKDALGRGVRSLGTSLRQAFSFSTDEIKLAKDSLKTIAKDLFKPLSNVFDMVKGIFSSGGGGGGGMGKAIQSVKGVFSSVGKTFSGIADFFQTAFGFLKGSSPFMRGLMTVGKMIGRLAWPITILMSVIDSVTGAFKGWNETEGGFFDKLFGALLGGITGFYQGIVGAPLNLLKDILSWALNLFGFENASKMLDSFDFNDIIENIIKSPLEMLKRAFNSIIEMVASGIEALSFIPGTGKAADALRNMKFEEGETHTEKRERKKEEKIELDKADAQGDERYLPGKFSSKKMAQVRRKKLYYAGGRDGPVVSLMQPIEQDESGSYRIVKKQLVGQNYGKEDAEKHRAKRVERRKEAEQFNDDWAEGKYYAEKKQPTQAVSMEGMDEWSAPPPVVVVNNKEGDTNASSNTTLAGETRPSTVNDRVGSTGFVAGVS